MPRRYRRWRPPPRSVTPWGAPGWRSSRARRARCAARLHRHGCGAAGADRRAAGRTGDGERQVERSLQPDGDRAVHRVDAHADVDAGVLPAGPRPDQVVTHRRLDGRLLLQEALLAQALLVDPGRAEVGAVEGRTVGEVVEALTLEVGGGGVGDGHDRHQQDAGEADDEQGDLPAVVTDPPGHRSGPLSSGALSTYWPMGTVWVASREKLADPLPKMAGNSGRSTPESTRTVITAVPTWQLPAGLAQVMSTRAACPGAPWSASTCLTAARALASPVASSGARAYARPAARAAALVAKAPCWTWKTEITIHTRGTSRMIASQLNSTRAEP